MREIKFKFYDTYKKTMFTTDEVNDYEVWDCIKSDRFKCNQYTELKDKNGVEIYEGDILKTDKGYFKVEYTAPSLSLVSGVGDYYNEGDFYVGEFSDTFDWNGFEVIGNIYENPELLK